MNAELNEVDRIIMKGKDFYVSYEAYCKALTIINKVYPAETEPTMNKYYTAELHKVYIPNRK